MKSQDLSFSLIVDRTPDEVFAAVNDVRAWWTGDITGDTDRLGGLFTYRYKDIHRSTQKITEWVPGKRVVWHVTESYLSFIEEKDEWDGTDVVFEISRKGGKTELKFTHLGLTPQVACYEGCSQGWGYYINESLLPFIITGKAQPKVEEDGKAA
ncbi:MAG: SRPBCC domain-containing protein [Gammaproteobacteria bacterium]